MSKEKEFQSLDVLLADAFRPTGAAAPPGFEARIMARIADAARGYSVWDVLRLAARPLLVSGWVAAALLALVALKGQGHGQDMAMAAFMNGDSLSRWLVL